MYPTLRDKELVFCYLEAIRFKLDEEFLTLLRTEIENRDLPISPDSSEMLYIRQQQHIVRT